MSAVLAEQWIELKQRHTAKWFARVLGVSVRTGKRYAEHPELFPESRAVELLVAIEREERLLEQRREARKLQREAVRREIQARLGMDDSRLALLEDRDRSGLGGESVRSARGSVPTTGHQSRGAK